MRKTLMILYRWCWIAFLAQLVAGHFVDFSWLWGLIPLGLAIVLQVVVNRQLAAQLKRDARASIETDPPVSGRWSALNSPADRVPSHGTHGYGQTYAIDIVADPEDRTRPCFGWWPIARGNRDFPAFGAPVRAVAHATVVRAVDRHRDHLSRNSFPALLYLIVESLVRDMVGPGLVTGNRVILDLGNGTYALYAHLQRGSLAVREGDRVRPGQLLARCGNSGNSTEPHVHFQLMDSPDLDVACGIPFTWRGVGVPRNGDIFSVDDEDATERQPATGT